MKVPRAKLCQEAPRLQREALDRELSLDTGRSRFILQAMGLDNSTRLYLAAGDIFRGETFMQPLYPHLENRTTVAAPEGLEAVQAEGAETGGGLHGVLALGRLHANLRRFLATLLLGHRLYYGFRASIQPNRKALAPIFMARESGGGGGDANFEAMVRGEVFPPGESRVVFTNRWPECFSGERCPATTSMNARALEEGGDGPFGWKDRIIHLSC
ncbi:O-fucosyltransferase 1 isoform X1 [Selaginella moellendorffii]|nr:O-fucosyltransferase 1 isoform X1 [Selaginella moellendorffii]XP_024537443.1 O-fucosyltransferase 1 isoform X1 [Selaginella moellendorffii]XP_024537444.1 O-fucosyltransferase 1 isoform X1 [Selaginella moellendorffii]|eukprot:XP_024537442.1 O-fucosyltransferase 1 isoform X1 [Selaginella moellendorffii]